MNNVNIQNEKTIIFKNGKKGITENPYAETSFDVVFDGGKHIHVLVQGYAIKKNSFDNLDAHFYLNDKEIEFSKDLTTNEIMMLSAVCQGPISHLCDQVASLYQQMHNLPESEMWE